MQLKHETSLCHHTLAHTYTCNRVNLRFVDMLPYRCICVYQIPHTNSISLAYGMHTITISFTREPSKVCNCSRRSFTSVLLASAKL